MILSPVARASFSREDRLRKRREFEECYASGIRVSGRHLQFFVRERDETSGPARLGISVSRKAGGSVERNRLRRRLREIFRKNREALPQKGLDLVVQCRPSAAQVPFSQLLDDFLNAAARVQRGHRVPGK